MGIEREKELKVRCEMKQTQSNSISCNVTNIYILDIQKWVN